MPTSEISANPRGPWWTEYIDADFAAFQENQFNLVAETILPPIGFAQESGKSPQLVTFDSVAFQYSFAEPDYWMALARLDYTAQRLRSYLAVAAAQPVSLRFALVGDRVTRGGLFDAGSPFGFRRIPGVEEPWMSLQDAQRSARKIVESARRIDSLMETLIEGTPLDRALSHMGNALWVVDNLDAFLHSWRAIEACFELELEPRRGLEASISGNTENPFATEVAKLLRSSGLPRPRPERFSGREKIGFTAFSTIKCDLREDIDDLVKARRAIAHGDVSLQDFRLISEKLPRLLAIAYRVTCSALLRQVVDARNIVEVFPNATIPEARIEYEMDLEMTKRIHQTAREEYERRQLRTEGR